MKLTFEELSLNFDSGLKYRERRHADWKDNYQLYRDKVITNRLTQRQSVNVPLMKETLSTLRANIAPIADLDFEDLGNNKDADLFFNEYWDYTARKNRLNIIDHVDTTQELLYGRSFIKLNIKDGCIHFEVIDPMDIIIDRYCDPVDIETARYIIHTNIFKTIGELEEDGSYDADAVNRLKTFYQTDLGLIKADQNIDALREKNERMDELGVDDVNNPVLGATYVILSEHIVKEWDDQGKMKHNVYVTAEGEIIKKKTLDEAMHIDFYPYVTWASDVEKTDFWSDGRADIVRTPNQILNVWLSQLVENRTMRNFGMNFYDQSQAEGWSPQGYTPAPFAFFGLPGKPKDFLEHVEIPELSESLDEMQFIINMVERATAATGIEKGENDNSGITLGEVQLLASKALTRISDVSKLKLQRDEDLGEKFQRIANANADSLDAVKLYRKNSKEQYKEKNVAPKDWKSTKGYKVRVVSKEQKEGESLDQVQKLRLAIQEFPTNAALKKIYAEKLLALANLTPDETKQVMDFEEQTPQMPPEMMGGMGPQLAPPGLSEPQPPMMPTA